VSGAQLTGTLNVAGNLTFLQNQGMYGGTINVGGNVVDNNSDFYGTTAINFNGTGAQSYSNTIGTNGTAYIAGQGALTVNKSSGTLTLSNSLETQYGNISVTAGTLDLGATPHILGADYYGAAGVITVSGATSNITCHGGCGAGTACYQGSGDIECLTLTKTSGGTVTP
jgi:hypothetical protein